MIRCPNSHRNTGLSLVSLLHLESGPVWGQHPGRGAQRQHQLPVPLGPASLQASTSAQAACVEVKVPRACSISPNRCRLLGLHKWGPGPAARPGLRGQRQHAVSKQPTPHTDLQRPLPEEEPGTAELSKQ